MEARDKRREKLDSSEVRMQGSQEGNHPMTVYRTKASSWHRISSWQGRIHRRRRDGLLDLNTGFNFCTLYLVGDE